MITEPGIYRPRSPQKTSFYQCIPDHLKEFIQLYDERYERPYGFWRPVIALVIAEEKISESLAQKIASWPHSGFKIHNEVEIDANDEKDREILAQYIINSGYFPLSNDYPSPYIIHRFTNC